MSMMPATTTGQPIAPLDPAAIRDAWQRSVRSTRPERNQASLNRSFLRSKQWLYFNDTSRRLEELPRTPGRVRATVNKLGPDSRRVLAKLMRRPLAFEVPATTPDDASLRAARMAESIIDVAHRDQDWESVRVEHAWATWEAGVGGVCVEWDSSIGTPVALDDKGRTIGTGDVKLSSVSIHEIAAEPGTRDIERARWWIRGQAFPPPEVQATYGLAQPPPADGRSVDGVWRLGDDTAREATPMTMVFTSFVRPQGAIPGRIVTVVGDDVVDEAPWYFPFTDRLNLATARVIPLYASWLGHTPITDAVPVQVLFNASWSSIVEHMRQAGNARLWVPMGSVEDIEELTDTPGEAVEYNPIANLRPVYESPPAMPDWWIRQPDMLRSEMDDIVGIHDISRGAAPGGVESGVALSILSEADDTPVGAMAKSLAECWGRVATMVLQLYEVKVAETRTATVANRRGVPEKVEWVGSDLEGQTTAVVPLDAVMPRSRAAQAAYALQLFDRQIITTPQQLAKVADLPDQDDLLAGIDPDTDKAERENYHLAQGTARLVDRIDDHANHITVHRNFMRSGRFDLFDEDRRLLFDQHLRAHEMYAAEQASEQTQALAVSPLAAATPTGATKPLDPSMVAANAAMESALPPGVAGMGQAMAPEMAPEMAEETGEQPAPPEGEPQ